MGTSFNSPPSISPGANIVQNGDMLIDQRNEGTSVTIATGTSPMCVDRWQTTFTTSTSSAGNPAITQQNASAGLNVLTKSLLLTANATPSTTHPAALVGAIYQSIEGADVNDLAFGTAGALPITVSLWIKSSVASGVWPVSIRNGATNRCFVHECSVPSSATWTKCTFTVPGDTSGTWNRTAGTVGMIVAVSFSTGSTLQVTADTWTGSNGTSTANQTYLTDSANATLEITGVKIERGAIATVFQSEPASVRLPQLRRFYQKSFPVATKPAQSAGVAGAITVKNPIALGDPSEYVQYVPQMYASPTVVTYNPSAANANWRDITASADATVSVDPQTTASASGIFIATSGTVSTLGDILGIHFTADCTL